MASNIKGRQQLPSKKARQPKSPSRLSRDCRDPGVKRQQGPSLGHVKAQTQNQLELPDTSTHRQQFQGGTSRHCIESLIGAALIRSYIQAYPSCTQ